MTRPTNVTGGSPFSGATGTIGAPTVQIGIGDIIDVDLVTTPPADGDVLTWDETTQTWVPAPGGTGSGLPIYDLVVDFGAACDNTTVDTAAVQAAVDQMNSDGGGLCIVPGLTLIDDSIVLPDVDYGDDAAVTIGFIGTRRPPAVPSVIGTTPLYVGPGFRTTDSSPVFTGSSTGGLDNFTNVLLYLRDLVIRTPADPSSHGLDLLKVANVDFERGQVDAGSMSIGSISSQSTSTSFGIRLPTVNNGATVRMKDVNVIGFYNGVRVSEHADLEGVFVWASRKPWVIAGSYHDMQFHRCGWYHCKQGIEFIAGTYGNESYFRWTDCNIERAHTGTWTQTGDDVVDASDYGHGDIMWHAVESSVGVVHTFVNGGATVYDLEIGEDPYSGGTPFSGDAVDVSIADAGSYYTSTDVEGALQEIGADLAAITPSTGHYEVIVSGTAPPVAVTNVDEDDWLYGFVPD